MGTSQFPCLDKETERQSTCQRSWSSGGAGLEPKTHPDQSPNQTILFFSFPFQQCLGHRLCYALEPSTAGSPRPREGTGWPTSQSVSLSEPQMCLAGDLLSWQQVPVEPQAFDPFPRCPRTPWSASGKEGGERGISTFSLLWELASLGVWGDAFPA